MKIVVSRSGGFAGMTRTWTVEVSPAEAEERWLPLIEGAGSSDSPGPQRDRYVYRIRVGYREVTFPESAVTGPWKELIERAEHGQPGPDKREE